MNTEELRALIETSNALAEQLEETAEKSSARTDFYAAAGPYRLAAVNAEIAILLARLTQAFEVANKVSSEERSS